jgi:N-acetylglucosaminyldiphosphoundecaprenol N-acetyl-beta-D-mannosaminyltransferase
MMVDIDVTPLPGRFVLGQRVDATSYQDATARVIDWALLKRSAYVCVTNVHMVMEGWDDAVFRKLVNAADLITPDGMPLVASLRLMGITSASRVYGPDLTLHVCEAAAKAGVSIALYGGTEQSIHEFTEFLERKYPGLRVACAISPPFRALTEEEDAAYTQQIVDSGAGVLFVGIGCPKQERWMAAHRDRLPLVMLGVGAAFDFHTGKVRQAPAWMQRLSLEWLFRMAMEPRRLWRRYIWHNPRFVVLMFIQLFKHQLRLCDYKSETPDQLGHEKNII